jgi:uncharacterized membrane protein
MEVDSLEPKVEQRPVNPVGNESYPNYPYPLVSPEQRKKEKGISEDAKIVIVIIVVIVVILGIMGVAFYTISSPPTTEETPLFSSEVLISNGGHFSYPLTQSYLSGGQVTINVSSSSGERFDVYIMDDTEYENAYGNTNISLISFSTYYAYEDLSQVSATLDIPVDRWFNLVIDNRDTPLTPNDATPTGVITVDVSISMESFGYID